MTFAQSIFAYSSEVIGTIAAAGLLVLVGALDDRYELDTFTKLAGQSAAAGVLALFGVQWSVLWLPWGDGGTGTPLVFSQGQAVAITALLTVALVNAMNFVDGLDGLAAGLGVIAAGATFLFSLGLLHKAGNDPNY